MKIYCCGCGHDIQARLTNGSEIYPHRKDLKSLPFWKCDECGNFVGCHKKSRTPTKPLGVIPSPELRNARIKIHEILDPIWKNGHMTRGNVYREIANSLGIDEYHTANIRNIEYARKVYKAILEIRRIYCGKI